MLSLRWSNHPCPVPPLSLELENIVPGKVVCFDSLHRNLYKLSQFERLKARQGKKSIPAYNRNEYLNISPNSSSGRRHTIFKFGDANMVGSKYASRECYATRRLARVIHRLYIFPSDNQSYTAAWNKYREKYRLKVIVG